MPFFQSGEKRLFYHRVDAGAAQKAAAPTLVFIHGLGSSHAFYGSVMNQLAGAGYSSAALDVHGSGMSELAPGSAGPTFESIGKDVESLLAHLKLAPEQVIVGGHSMGGIVVSNLAAQHNLKGAVLIGPVLPKPALGEIFTARIAKVREAGMEAMADTIPVAATGSRSTQTHKAFIRALILSQKVEGYAGVCQAIAQAERPQYSKAKSPVLILAGSEDKTSPVADSRVILEEWGSDDKSKRLEILEGVGHWHCIEAADEVGDKILNLLSQLS
ncbi:uncharacterized protein E0L32_007558 [Thyridium curvatum]|uniref:Serine aminopeptidase S33 domain-containing protein n=1 Tax=Thyridium curvatum TaxID=1093900 RepID=A0A507B436_9PEZI|nr:uncharacterized protein E0L32_007558 [Thyridium curvatum]TPX11821.1 hypothetical protein E0L32_007558 [Thyridium curvatum]